jgi:predicted glutamine amidotransferase
MDEKMLSNIKGQPDSEILFHWVHDQIERGGDAMTAIEAVIATVLGLKERKTTALNFTLCDGERVYALNLPLKRFDYYTLAWKGLPAGGVFVGSVPIDDALRWTHLRKGELPAACLCPKVESRFLC